MNRFVSIFGCLIFAACIGLMAPKFARADWHGGGHGGYGRSRGGDRDGHGGFHHGGDDGRMHRGYHRGGDGDGVHRWHRGDGDGWRRPEPGPVYYPNNDYYYGEGSCSPQVKVNSVTTVEKVLDQAARSQEFQNAAVFQHFVANTEAQPSVTAKMKAYFSAIGVNANNPKQVVEFIGARNRLTYFKAAETNLRLTPQQAQTLVQNLGSSLVQLISK